MLEGLNLIYYYYTLQNIVFVHTFQIYKNTFLITRFSLKNKDLTFLKKNKKKPKLIYLEIMEEKLTFHALHFPMVKLIE